MQDDGVQNGQENGDIIINLTNMISNQKAKIDELEQKNKSLNSEIDPGLFATCIDRLFENGITVNLG